MSYATLADIEARIGTDRLHELADYAASGVADHSAVLRALTDAAAEIDAHLATRYRLPLPSVPGVLTRVACDIAIYRLTSLRRVGDIEDARLRYEDARRFLEAVAKGDIALAIPADAPRPSLSLAAARSGPPPVFGRDATGGF